MEEHTSCFKNTIHKMFGMWKIVAQREANAESKEVKSSLALRTFRVSVSKLEFECTVLSGPYNYPLSDEEGIPIIMYAFSKVITFFDTANIYGESANESLVGKVASIWEPTTL
ncbi:conserved hypothetical protein [Ricinus communis]|uniref:NADP-dependent oxidoreductase domain-containing protein n=1 Tax=Ricinus communis TaxID=3988 RepID=B9S4P1_RICCO|nr:conserved hypothetical protein [Ricinus communis]